MVQDEFVLTCQKHGRRVSTVGETAHCATLNVNVGHAVEQFLKHDAVGMTHSLKIIHGYNNAATRFVLVMAPFERGHVDADEVAAPDELACGCVNLTSAIGQEEDEQWKLIFGGVVLGQSRGESCGLAFALNHRRECFRQLREFKT